MSISDWLMRFPSSLVIAAGKGIDEAVARLSREYSSAFDAISGGLLVFINQVQSVVDIIPWWVMIAAVFLLGWKLKRKATQGAAYALLLMLVGVLGLWELMYMTLGLVISSVIISLLIGLPVGILIASYERAEGFMKPLLDAMQTMPTFVYLIPAVMFFGMGKVPALIATTIYAAPPVIRLTSHAIRQVDRDVVEAAKAFGSTRWQLLFKVQIPQALPTIMTGINQTMMMAMAMVVTCAMIGAKGLGMEVIIGINRLEIGRGLRAGIAIVIIAVLMDRLTQGWFRKESRAGEGVE